MDFTTSWHNRSVGPVGILRCEYELARYLLSHHADEVVFGIFDPAEGGYRELGQTVVRALLTRTPGEARTVLPLPRGLAHRARAVGVSMTAGGYVAAAMIGGRLGGATTRLRWSNRAKTHIARHRDYVLPRVFRTLVPRFVPERDAYIERLELLLGSLRSLDLPPGEIPAEKIDLLKLEAFDTLILAGVFWAGDKARTIAEFKSSGGKPDVFVLIYDMIPIKVPHLSESVAVVEFERALGSLVEVAEGFACISKSTENDFRSYLAGSGHRPRVETRALALGPGPLLRYRNEDKLQAPDDPRLEPGGFALFVSTIEVRKNHAFAHQLWRRMVEKHGSRVPPLVFAGRRGWGVGNLLELIETDPVIGDRAIIHLDGVSDPTLAWLYANCAFTIFPSHYEGWGMPITESLAFGKACIAADNSSLREASQGLAIHIDPLDGLGWLAAIEKHAFDPVFRARIEQRIEKEFAPTSWDDFGKGFMDMTAHTAAEARG